MRRITKRTDKTTTTSDGDFSTESTSITFTIDPEPPYVKMYLDAVLYLKDLPGTFNPILMAFLRLMPWANNHQTIAINKYIKEMIAKEIGCSLTRVDHALGAFVKGELLFRKGTGTYQFNPHLFGKGEWRDIESLRLTIDFDSRGKTVMGEIKRKEEENKYQLAQGA